jgi:nucleoside-diphosphate-sugar epimerase
VYVVTRSQERAEKFAKLGYNTIIADVCRPETLDELPPAETILFSVGCDRRDGRTVYETYVNGLGNVLNALPENAGRIIYISTTGVYGRTERAGDVVDETTPPAPQSEGGIASLAAERLLRTRRSGVGKQSVILRLAGIYGPARIPFLAELAVGKPVPAPAEGYLNLIHVEDAAAAVIAAEECYIREGPALYCVSDGCPVARRDFYAELSRCVGGPPPQFCRADPQSRRAQRATSSKRVSNAHMLRELRIHLSYPTYREGLIAALRDDGCTFPESPL